MYLVFEMFRTDQYLKMDLEAVKIWRVIYFVISTALMILSIILVVGFTLTDDLDFIAPGENVDMMYTSIVMLGWVIADIQYQRVLSVIKIHNYLIKNKKKGLLESKKDSQKKEPKIEKVDE